MLQFYHSGVLAGGVVADGCTAPYVALLTAYTDRYWTFQHAWGEHWGERGFARMTLDHTMVYRVSYALFR